MRRDFHIFVGLLPVDYVIVQVLLVGDHFNVAHCGGGLVTVRRVGVAQAGPLIYDQLVEFVVNRVSVWLELLESRLDV